ncbi:MAG: PIG-L family deacetylase [Ignavibacteriales bacterium]|nr:PIG-L family deacetylase [Ignavibacteriales bacterium]
MAKFSLPIKFLTFVLLLNLNQYSSFAQSNLYSSSEIYQSLKKLNVLGSVLYIAAHPDDENTAVLAFMSKGQLTKTAYLSLTRGDGGQNLLGNEQGDLLGVIRTEELLSARRIDGAEQFFSRAIDFGYSKTTEETLKNWDKELLLGDVVKVIRQFRPDVILTRFSKTQGGHGHHLTSAILAEEAFYAAADPNRFQEQLKELEPWQAKRLYWNTWSPSEKAIAIDIGEYSKILGKSYNELSAESRSMHKSQGFGVSPSRGSQLQYFDYLAGDSAHKNLFDGIDISWKRFHGGAQIESKINLVINAFDPENPEKIIPDLVDIYIQVDEIDDKYWSNKKKDEIKEIIKMCSGLWMESIVWESEISPGQNIDVKSMIVNRSNFPIVIEEIATTFSNSKKDLTQNLELNKPVNSKENISIPFDQEYTTPYWLKEKHNNFWFTISEENMVKPKLKPTISTKFKVKINGETFIYEVPTVHRWNDAVNGEQIRPFAILPEISLSVDQNSLVFPNGKTHVVNVNVISKIDSANGKLKIDLPNEWQLEPKSIDFSIVKKGDKKSFSFKITPSVKAISGEAKILAEMNGKVYRNEIIEIDYPHIDYQRVLKPVELNLVRLDIKIEPRKIAYIMGSGDEIPQSLTQIGFNVDILTDEDLDNKDISDYDVIICGVRAFNTRQDLARQQTKLIEFVKNGGTWIVQHNTRFGFQVDQIGPYPFSTNGRDRIAEEDAKLEILVPKHQIFNFPNKITQKDFEGWVQERGLYFADSWEGKLYPLLAGNDEGEPSKLGGLLYANYGKGAFIFTALSWFRQLPAGVPGAYRLFVNIISAKGSNE